MTLLALALAACGPLPSPFTPGDAIPGDVVPRSSSEDTSETSPGNTPAAVRTPWPMPTRVPFVLPLPVEAASPTPSPTATPNPLAGRDRGPDLVPFAPEGWDAPLVASAYPGDTVQGPLSVDEPTYVRIALRNAGLSSVADSVVVNLYYDDGLVSVTTWDHVLAGDVVRGASWDELPEIRDITPGEHTLRVEIDPDDEVAETDETNNIFESTFSWGTGPVASKPRKTPTPRPALPSPPVFPNLVPGFRYGSDGPIVVSHQRDTGFDDPLTVDRPPFVDLLVQNQSTVDSHEDFSIDLYFDELLVESFTYEDVFPGTSYLFVEDWPQLAIDARILPGEHTLRIEIDPENKVVETNENDNSFERTFFWSIGPPLEPEDTVYTDEELYWALADVAVLLDVREPALDGPGIDYSERVWAIADAGYYLLTGRSLFDERVELLLLTTDEYRAWLDGHYAARFKVKDESEYAEIMAKREHLKDRPSFKTRSRGKVTIVMDGGQPLGEVISSAAHEIGHMRQDFLNPAQSQAEGVDFLDGLQEAQAQQFERAFWLRVEEFLGQSIMSYPDYPSFRRFIRDRFDFLARSVYDDEHWMGFVIQWLAVLNDPALSSLQAELVEEGALSSRSSEELFEYLAAMDLDSVETYVPNLLRRTGSFAGMGEVIAMTRLKEHPGAGGEGPVPLRLPALLMP